jgi:hypothetical protein
VLVKVHVEIIASDAFYYASAGGRTPVSESTISNERFWALIDLARAGSCASAPPSRLRKVLETLDDQKLLQFGHKFYENLCDLNHWNLWAAGHVITGGMGDDSFHYFRSWIIGKGKTAFDIALRDPDELAPLIDKEEVDNELLEYVALEVLADRGIEEDPRERSDCSPDDEPKGEPFEEETAAGRFPKLAARCRAQKPSRNVR